jgi:hypothetical protein
VDGIQGSGAAVTAVEGVNRPDSLFHRALQARASVRPSFGTCFLIADSGSTFGQNASMSCLVARLPGASATNVKTF